MVYKKNLFLSLFIIMMLTTILNACHSNSKFLIANIPAYLSGSYNQHLNIAYGDKVWQKLDVYVPKKIQNAPVVTFLYGGGWYTGHKQDYQFFAHNLTENGFVVVIPDYGKYPQQKYPAFQHDIALVTAWINQNIHHYHGNSKNVHLIGHSAGGHIGMMLIADKSHLKAVNLTPNFFKSFVGLSAPYHFEPKEKKYKAVFSDLTDYSQMQATHFIDGSEPPMLLIHGNLDTVVGKINIERLSKALDKHHNFYDVHYYDADHSQTISAFTKLPRIRNQQIVSDVLTFIKKHSL